MKFRCTDIRCYSPTSSPMIFSLAAVATLWIVTTATPAFAQSKTNIKRGSVTNRGGFNRAAQPPGADKTLAQVGQVIVGETIIRSRPADNASTKFRVPRNTQVAVVDGVGMYWGVLMADRTIAWIRKDAIELLDYNVEMLAPIGDGTALPTDNPPPISSSDPTGSGDSGETMTRFSSDASGAVRAILQEAATYLGVPYRWAWNSRAGTDCSGFTMNVYRTAGVRLPRVSSEQANVGQPVAFEELQAGDRLYFDCSDKRPGVDHTGICIGSGYLIHASGGRGKVVIEKLDTAYWRSHFVTGRRDF
jgi:cell wall-associated NlpC family hydrolase